MLHSAIRKNKINLNDYSYKKDITNRLILADFTPTEVEVLQELLFHPSKCLISELADTVSCSQKELDKALETFSKIGLTAKQQEHLFIDKELRKYFEFHITKFQDSFEPSFEFLIGLLAKVPISVLPLWYSIPRSSDNIFSSIVEKYLHTPKIYESYLKELSFDEPILHQIVEDVFSSASLKVETETLRRRYSLSREKMQEYLLLLEFHLVLASSFYKGKEVVSPFFEWAEVLRFHKHNALEPLKPDAVAIAKPALIVGSREQQEETMNIFRKTLDSWHKSWGEHIGSIEKSVFEIEKALRVVPTNTWISLEGYINSLSSPIGLQAPVTLLRTGKKWRYNLPKYTPKEKTFIELVITELLYNMGVTATGTFKDKSCFMITPFGRVVLGEA